uniref:Membrane insertase YidC/Oxa/ALB C-terminal domain-containing protein n=1 Tax=Chromera velia CCMP2878 TaxID=1169474 RepID=A0A0G4F2R3_9ALVE|mmetsp:Transcript_28987/g.56744  ORF Transcript_28987/g.56744 Transcript_28987/m.56744 type:complete len:456 (+) Transcript_28987:166-1533(+)|eukprot:Cvel_14862.t1-p1 / transcript=Cvel_14862.t1 / gene=Cvel_14862 / organism=Chromera_velia_CCMP2878 / gene_product=Inner membrane ALBINO3-like protein 2,, putative / transcript_product=Inner membrane ALBINO3-like protein 2,, putative / location=Cvel_scaffold1074:39894-43761(+) / protein_length=455 / sequence_SO=supercontig / SO=protein_coding / is_pseudo=false
MRSLLSAGVVLGAALSCEALERRTGFVAPGLRLQRSRLETGVSYRSPSSSFPAPDEESSAFYPFPEGEMNEMNRNADGTALAAASAALPFLLFAPSLAQAADSAPSVTQAVTDAGATAAADPSWFDQFIALVQGSIVSVHEALEAQGISDFGWAIIAVTIMIRILVSPIQAYSTYNARKTQALNPMLQEIKKKFGYNPQLQQYVTGLAMQEAKTNPLAGVLPSFAQIPVFIALYRSLSNLSQTSQLDEPFLWIPTLQGPTFGQNNADWLFKWVDGVPKLGWEQTALYLILPALYTGVQFVTQALLTPSKKDDPNAEQNEQIAGALKFLPLLVGWFSLSVSSALVLYWIASNIFVSLVSFGMRSYFDQNPITTDLNLEDILPPSIKRLMPAKDVEHLVEMSWEDHLAEAELHELPDRKPARVLLAELRPESPAVKALRRSPQAETEREPEAVVASQ